MTPAPPGLIYRVVAVTVAVGAIGTRRRLSGPPGRFGSRWRNQRAGMATWPRLTLVMAYRRGRSPVKATGEQAPPSWLALLVRRCCPWVS
jgi:hypothetical protein